MTSIPSPPVPARAFAGPARRRGVLPPAPGAGIAGDGAAGSPAGAISFHARVRMQQRAIPPEAVDLVLAYGREAHDHHGAVICYLDKAARRRLERDGRLAALRHADRVLNAYVVLSTEGQVVTVGHRLRRLRRG